MHKNCENKEVDESLSESPQKKKKKEFDCFDVILTVNKKNSVSKNYNIYSSTAIEQLKNQ